MRRSVFTLVAAAALLGALAVPAAAGGASADLRLSAVHDKPGPVEVEVTGWDHKGTELFSKTLEFANDDNVFGEVATTIPKKTRVLRVAFVNDFYVPGHPDSDRNLFLDWFAVNHLRYEGEAFDRTGGPDPFFPGCATASHTDAAGTQAMVTDCGNQGDWVEYDLHPGNPVGPGNGIGKGPKP